MQMPDELLRAVVDFDLPPPGHYGVLMCFLPARGGRVRAPAGAARAHHPRRGPARARLARGAGGHCLHGPHGGRLPTRDLAAVRGGGRAACRLVRAGSRERVGHRRGACVRGGRAEGGRPFDQDAFERKLFVIRRVCELSFGEVRSVRDLQLLAHDQLQGHADLQAARRLLHRPARPARQERDGAGALALLDQHLPELGAGAPLPRDLPQRGVQHGDGQRQLDARPRE